MYNEEQYHIINATGNIQDVRVVEVPSEFECGYMYDFEWPYTDSDNGQVYMVGYYHDSSQKLHTSKWESQHLDGLTPTTTLSVHNYTQPWEGLTGLITNAAEPPPFHFPGRFYRLNYVAWDRKPLDNLSLKELKERDMSWKTRQGTPTHYYREQKQSNVFYLYPIPSSVTWGTSGSTYDDADPDTAAYGSTTLDVDNNILLIFDKIPTELTSESSTSELPVYLRKFVEYGVIANAYSTNSDGRIGTLAEYWNMRREVAINIIKSFKSKIYSDRDYQLQTKSPYGRRKYKHPRLPDEYPAVYP
jgi:hypothetical protein